MLLTRENIDNRGRNNHIEIGQNVHCHGDMRITVVGDNNKLVIGSNTLLKNGIIRLDKDESEITIGEQCVINAFIHCIASHTKVNIGSNTTIGLAYISLHEKGLISLGKDCMLSGDISMDVSDAHSILDAATLKRINPPEDIIIGEHVWIGQGVNIFKGVTIGANTLIGAKSIVTDSIPRFSIAVGIPAKVLKTGTTWDRNILPMPD